MRTSHCAGSWSNIKQIQMLFTVLRCAHKADIPPHEILLRDQSLPFLAKGLVTSSLFLKKMGYLSTPQGFHFVSPLNHLISTLNTYHKSHCHHDIHTTMADRGYVCSMNPKHA